MEKMDFKDRDQKSPCCGGRVYVKLETVDTQVGRQVVWGCVTCGRLQVYICRDHGEE